MWANFLVDIISSHQSLLVSKRVQKKLCTRLGSNPSLQQILSASRFGANRHFFGTSRFARFAIRTTLPGDDSEVTRTQVR